MDAKEKEFREQFDRLTVMVSDCHLAAGPYVDGRKNPHEDFHYDDEMVDLFHFFSTGLYGDGPFGPREVELVIGGDFLDFLSVAVDGEFKDGIFEELALFKCETILRAHPEVMNAIREFASKPGKKVTYLIGNHDTELFFEKVREKIIRRWDPSGNYPSEKVKIISDDDRIIYPEGVEIHHGNQHEIGNDIDFKAPFFTAKNGRKYLKLPWGSIYCLKILNTLKWEREYCDKIRPMKVFFFFGLIFDTFFTLRFAFLTAFYFIKTRLFNFESRSRFKIFDFIQYVRTETRFLNDLEMEARSYLDRNPDVQTIIFGHTHKPMNRTYPDGRQYINTGSWTKMIMVDWVGIGENYKRTFALIYFKNGQAQCELRQWVGEHSPHQLLQN